MGPIAERAKRALDRAHAGDMTTKDESYLRSLIQQDRDTCSEKQEKWLAACEDKTNKPRAHYDEQGGRLGKP